MQILNVCFNIFCYVASEWNDDLNSFVSIIFCNRIVTNKEEISISS